MPSPRARAPGLSPTPGNSGPPLPRQEPDPAGLRSSLRAQPLLAVLRPSSLERGLRQVEPLAAVGWQHLELAWTVPFAGELALALQHRHPRLRLGAASVTNASQLDAVARLGLTYVFLPILDEDLLRRGRRSGLTVVPGVFSPTEVHQARRLGCRMVKLFPAASLGPSHWQRLHGPLGGLPFVVAAGGLAMDDVIPWRRQGIDAVALGQRLFDELEVCRPDVAEARLLALLANCCP